MKKKKGLDYSKDNIYDAMGRPDLKRPLWAPVIDSETLTRLLVEIDIARAILDNMESQIIRLKQLN